ncbi:putative importin subunit alpha B [Tieghemostelium lacteum]|uniref:Importin subunit alpha n=1 Tax=Tieghemostelium lacteum TaxID=361077 RepID=A0A151Z2U5_TIELA|nr:putative importin subunit alpha B [Tieghemostelium lacteum]|eukprot:KYQ88268.1 putative importin subunit alpha B [Tieghemostelium lacteum]
MGDPVDISQFPKILANMGSTNEEVLTDAVTSIRKILSPAPQNDRIDLVIRSGLIPRLHYLLQFGTPKQALESSWALTNALGTTEHTNFIVENGILHTFIVLLNSPDLELAEKCLWGIGNISGDSEQMRDFALSLNVTDAIVQLSQKSCPDNLIRIIAWNIGNLLRDKSPDIKYGKRFLPVLLRLIKVDHLPTSDELFIDTLYSFTYVSKHSECVEEICFEFQNIGTLRKLISFLDYRPTQLPTLRVLGNLLAESNSFVAAILDFGLDFLLHFLVVFLGYKKQIYILDSLWILSNITAKYEKIVQRVIDFMVFQKVFDFCVLGSHKVRKEALYVVTNTLITATPQQVEYLVSIDLAKLLGVSLDYVIQNEDIHNNFFRSLKAVFTKPEGDQLVQICDNFHTHGWNDHFEKLLNAKVDDFSSKIIKETFYIYTEGHKQPTISSDNIIIGLTNFHI